MQIYNVDRGKCMYAVVPDEVVKLPVTCVRFCPLPVDSQDMQRSHIIAATCKPSNSNNNNNNNMNIINTV